MELHQITKKLNEYTAARITEKELRQYVDKPDYEAYYRLVMALVEHQVLDPVKSSGSNGMHPPLYKRYVIHKPEKDYDDLISEIRLLQDSFNIEGYLVCPEKYHAHRPWIDPLNRFLKQQDGALKMPLSINERSFQIFHKEKALKEDRELAAVLAFSPGLREVLNFYDTPEPFFIYDIASGKEGGKKCRKVLIIENKDTWYTLRSILSPQHCSIAGICFDSLLYGEGKKITRKKDSLTEFDQSYFKGAKTNYYYFGDLDYEGIGIVHDLMCTNPGLQILLMMPLYSAMLEASKGLTLPATKENQNKKATEWFLSFFEAAQQVHMKNLLESGRYIPQEILNNRDFMKMVVEGEKVEGQNV